MVLLNLNPLGVTQRSTRVPKPISDKKGKIELLIIHDTVIEQKDLVLLSVSDTPVLFRRCYFGVSCQRALGELAYIKYRLEECNGLRGF
jgi:hypothetical protein